MVLGRRTGIDVKAGKTVRKHDCGTEVFDDYWTESESDANTTDFNGPAEPIAPDALISSSKTGLSLSETSASPGNRSQRSCRKLFNIATPELISIRKGSVSTSPTSVERNGNRDENDTRQQTLQHSFTGSDAHASHLHHHSSQHPGNASQNQLGVRFSPNLSSDIQHNSEDEILIVDNPPQEYRQNASSSEKSITSRRVLQLFNGISNRLSQTSETSCNRLSQTSETSCNKTCTLETQQSTGLEESSKPLLKQKQRLKNTMKKSTYLCLLKGKLKKKLRNNPKAPKQTDVMDRDKSLVNTQQHLTAAITHSPSTPHLLEIASPQKAVIDQKSFQDKEDSDTDEIFSLSKPREECTPHQNICILASDRTSRGQVASKASQSAPSHHPDPTPVSKTPPMTTEFHKTFVRKVKQQPDRLRTKRKNARHRIKKILTENRPVKTPALNKVASSKGRKLVEDSNCPTVHNSKMTPVNNFGPQQDSFRGDNDSNLSVNRSGSKPTENVQPRKRGRPVAKKQRFRMSTKESKCISEVNNDAEHKQLSAKRKKRKDKSAETQDGEIAPNAHLNDDVFVPNKVDDEVTGGVRPKRTRIPPVEYWRNERVNYKSSPSGAVILGVLPGFPRDNWMKTTRNDKYIGGAVRKKTKIDSVKPKHLSIQVKKMPDMDSFPDLPQAYAKILCPVTGDDVMADIVPRPLNSLIWTGPLGLEPQESDPLIFTKAFQHSHSSSGFLHIRPLQEKPLQYLSRDSVYLFVLNGKLLVEIYENAWIVETGATIYIPQGNSYSIKNLQKEVAKLHFVTVCGAVTEEQAI